MRLCRCERRQPPLPGEQKSRCEDEGGEGEGGDDDDTALAAMGGTAPVAAGLASPRALWRICGQIFDQWRHHPGYG